MKKNPIYKRALAFMLAVVVLSTTNTWVADVFAKPAEHDKKTAETSVPQPDQLTGESQPAEQESNPAEKPKAGPAQEQPAENIESAVQPAETQPQPAQPESLTHAAVDNSEPEETIQPEEQPTALFAESLSEPEPQSTAEDINIDVNSRILVNNQPSASTVQAGEIFQYEFSYTVVPLSSASGGQYQNCTVTVKLPEHVKPETYQDADGKEQYNISGKDVKAIIYNPQSNTLRITLKVPLTQNVATAVIASLYTDNLSTPENKALDFSASTLTGSFQPTANGDFINFSKTAAPQSVTVLADDEWNIEKSLVDKQLVNETQEYYDVTYQVRVSNRDGVNRNGRLLFTNYSISDTFPKTLPDGAPLPKDGEAVSVSNVQMLGVRNLSEGTDKDYVVQKDANGKAAGITFLSLDQVTETDAYQFVPVGTEKDTIYQYTVRYRRAPYITPATEEPRIYKLVNTATLAYTLLGRAEVTKQAKANVDIIDSESNPITVNLTAQKLIRIGNEVSILNKNNQAFYQTATFGLYTDKECTKVASDVGRQPVEQSTTDRDGKVYFQNIRYGTYYLKEINVPNGFRPVTDPVQITIDQDRTITTDSEDAPVSNGVIEITNQAEQIGALEFWKKGKNAAEGKLVALGGVTFSLAAKKDPDKEIAVAVSASDGKVRFDGIMEGTYILKEKALQNGQEDYIIDPAGREVTIKGNAVTKPVFGDDGNVFLNQSPKGKLKIIKKDAQDTGKLLSGAAFDIYGPYVTEEEAKTAGNIPDQDALIQSHLTTNANGTAVSDALAEGYYIIKETEAPINHTLKETVDIVKVTKQSTVKKEILNDPQTKVRIRKLGSVSSTSLLKKEVAGAKFKLYADVSGTPLKGKYDKEQDIYTVSESGEEIVLESKLDVTGRATSSRVYLSPGTYFYEEIYAPAPYTKIDGKIGFTVAEDASLDWDLRIENHVEFGQIQLIKEDAVTKDKTGQNLRLNGATFGIYADAACTDLKEELTTARQLISVEEESGNLKDEWQDGVAFSTAQLEIGREYYLKETKAPDGYALNPEVVRVQVSNKEVYKVTVADAKTAQLTIHKTDSYYINPVKGIDGAEFTLYDEAFQPLASPQTTKGGVCTFTGLQPDTVYYYRETKVPEGYALAEGIVEHDGVWYDQIKTKAYINEESLKNDVTVTNDRLGKLLIQKTTAVNGNTDTETAFAGVPFTLYKKGDITKEYLKDTGKQLIGKEKQKTAANGTLAWDRLVPGAYWLVEELPDGYQELNAAGTKPIPNAQKVITIMVQAGQNQTGYFTKTEAIQNRPTQGKIKIGKFGVYADGTINKTDPLGGVQFQIQDQDGTVVSTLTTGTAGDTKGFVTSGWLVPGTYTVRESKPLEGYLPLHTVYTVVVEAGKTAVADTSKVSLTELTNQKQGSFQITKYGAFESLIMSGGTLVPGDVVLDRLSGAEFDLYPYQTGETEHAPGAVSVKHITMSGYQVKVTGIDPGEYWLSETKVPEGDWEKAADTRIKIHPDGTTQYGTGKAEAGLNIDVKDYSTKPRIRIHKTEYGNDNLTIDGANFELYKMDPSGTAVTIQGQQVKLVLLQGGDPAKYLQTGTAFQANGNGKKASGDAITEKLSAGVYYLKEISVPSPYYFDKENPWTGPIVITEDTKGEVQVPVRNYKEVAAPGTKTKPDGSPLQGAIMAVFRSRTDANQMLNALNTQYNEAIESKRLKAAEAKTELFQGRYHVDQIAESDKNGIFRFQNLLPDTTYYIMEIVAPSVGNTVYQIEKTPEGAYFYHTAVTNNPITDKAPFQSVDGNQNQHTLSIKDPEMQQIWIKKICRMSGQDFLLEGAEFTIYDSKLDDNQQKVPDTDHIVDVITAGKGEYISKLLPGGTYFIKETKTPDGFAKEPGAPEYYQVELSTTADHKVYYEQPIINIAENGKFSLRKEDSLTKKAVEAVFAVEKYNEGTGIFESYPYDTDNAFTTPKVLAADQGFLSEFMKPGLYQLTEKTASGYTLLSEPFYVRIASDKITGVGTGSPKEETVVIGGTAKTLQVYQPMDADVKPILLQNVPQGSIKLHKTKVWNGQNQGNMQGVTFALYQKKTEDFAADKKMQEEDGDAAFPRTGKTDGNGNLIFGKLDAGYYWVIEKSVAAGDQDSYGAVSYAAFDLQVTPGAQTSREVENQSNYGKFKVLKTDSKTGLPITAGTTFQILTGAHPDAPLALSQGIVSDNKGGYTSPLLSPGQYWLKETVPPTDYKNEQNQNQITGPYTVTANTLTDAKDGIPYKVTNERDCVLTVEKYRQDQTGQTTTLITEQKAVFALYKTQAEAEAATYEAPGSPVRGGKNGSGDTISGKVTWTGLANGTYWLKELLAPWNYIGTQEVMQVRLDNRTDVETDGTRKINYIQKVYNIARGSFTIKKVVNWGSSEGKTELLPLQGVVFDVKDSGGRLVGTITTDAFGLAHSNPAPKEGTIDTGLQLFAGSYTLEERALNGYASLPPVTIEVKNSEHNIYYVDHPIINTATWGRFQLTKTDATGKLNLSGATFWLEKKNAAGSWDRLQGDGTGTDGTFLVSEEQGVKGVYLSGMMEAGDYRVIERTAPTSFESEQAGGGKLDTEFVVDKTPVEFRIDGGTTVAVTKANSPKLYLEVTKTSDQTDIPVLKDVRFQLWTYEEQKGVSNPTTPAEILGHKGSKVDDVKTTNQEGKASWAKLPKGKYVLEEVSTPAGYAPAAKVITLSEGAVTELLRSETLHNVANQGRIRIRKTGTDGKDICTESNGLSAVFKIYKGTDDTFKSPLQTVTVENGRDGISTLLDTGTYWVKEVKAPNGYTLDDKIAPTAQKVTVTAIHNPAAPVNTVVFKNYREDEAATFVNGLQKGVRLDRADSYIDEALSDKSILLHELTAQFKLSNFTNGKNTLPAEKFVITDESIKLQGLQPGSEHTYQDIAANPDGKDYDILSITIEAAKNAEASQVVKGTLEYKSNGGTWSKVPDSDAKLKDLTNVGAKGITIPMPAGAKGFRLSYGNVQKQFTAGDITMDVVFHQRSWSDQTLADVRRIVNTAVLDWEDQRLDPDGNANHQTGQAKSSASIKLPSYRAKLPVVSLTNQITNKSDGRGIFYSGEAIQFRSEGLNQVVEGQNVNLKEPVMSIMIPPYTSLNENKYQTSGVSGFRASLKNGVVLKNFTVTKADDIPAAKTSEKPASKKRAADAVTTSQYILKFDKTMELQPGDSIIVEYETIIGDKLGDSVLSLQSQAYLGSTYQLPSTTENPAGRSFLAQGTLTGDGVIDSAAPGTDGKPSEYLEQPVSVQLMRSETLQIVKYIGTEEGNYLNPGGIASVHPTDLIYYRLSLINGGNSDVKTARFVDILPFNGDSYEFRTEGATTRDTTIPAGQGYDKMSLLSVDGNPNGLEGVEQATVYYYTGNTWDAESRKQKAPEQELPMLWKKEAGTFNAAGWTSAKPEDMSKVTAIGVDVTFKDDALLKPKDTYNVTLTMKTPGYTAEEIEDYKGKQMANSVAAAIVKAGDTALTAAIPAEDHVQSAQVLAKLSLPTGKIGDYAFYDQNNDGIQNQGDTPVGNLPVTLYQTKKSISGKADTKEYPTVLTDSTTGKYEFTNLPCNYLTKEAAKDPGYKKDPANPKYYVGGVYYSYKVKFGIPDRYAATTQYVHGKAGQNTDNADSNINQEGYTDEIVLSVNEDKETKALYGEENMTIDAGFVIPVSLGDYVWIDSNKNGIQDIGQHPEDPDDNTGEVGLDGAIVYLYKVDGAGGTVKEGQEPYARQTTHLNTATNQHGYYCFEKLPQGYYVVEYDVTKLTTDGYTPKYEFTKASASASGEADSDAKYPVNGNDRDMRTDVIHLTKDDMSWDAGVSVYSALGGYSFDDEDYDNIQSKYIDLLGTKVTLYKVTNGVREEKPVASQMVGTDGRYFFDHLDGGEYQVHFQFPKSYIAVEPGATKDETLDSEVREFQNGNRNAGFTGSIYLPSNTVDLTHDSGAYLLSSIGDYVWFDQNKNGLQDAEEPPVAEVPVLLQQRKKGSDWTTVRNTVTDAKGYYSFQDLKSSRYTEEEYRVVFAFGEDTLITKAKAGSSQSMDSNALQEYIRKLGYVTDAVKPGYGQNDMTWDAGVIKVYSAVGDYVWYDQNQNGLQDTDEQGISGIKVILQKSDGARPTSVNDWNNIATTLTDKEGKYLFDELEPGYYRVGFEIKDPYMATQANGGETNDAFMIDSDASRRDRTMYYSRMFYLEAEQRDMTWDAGIFPISERKIAHTTIKKTEIVKEGIGSQGTTRQVVTRGSTAGTSAKSAKTGDDIPLFVYLAVCTAAGAVGCGVYAAQKRKKSKKRQ